MNALSSTEKPQKHFTSETLLNLTLWRAFNDTGLILLTDWASRHKLGRIQRSAV